jgi:hypothetical protein
MHALALENDSGIRTVCYKTVIDMSTAPPRTTFRQGILLVAKGN